MRYSLILIMTLLVYCSCNHSSTESKFFGQSFDTSRAITVASLTENMRGQQRTDVVISGVITESCQSEGCWLNLKNPAGDDVFVDWDHEFNLPKDISGRRVIAKGYAYYDSTKEVPQLSFKASGVYL